ncbi:MAG: MerR family transcriptional regulator [Bacteroidales bacterium]|nr:MerR family transcriptional regulator [Bacteroidales bacterium]
MKEVSDVYSIKDLEYFTGIKAHTIRIWEKRYSILAPERTDSNIRMYTEEELKKLLNVAYLNRNGYKISKIARLSEDELNSTVLSVSSKFEDPNQEFHPGRALMSALRFEENKLIESLQPFFEKHGFEITYSRFLAHLLENARILWQTGSLSRAQENFIRNIVRELMLTQYHSIETPVSNSRFVFAVLNTTGEAADIPLLFCRYVIRNLGFDVISPGEKLPAGEITEIHKMRPFNILVMSYNGTGSDSRSLDYYSKLGKMLGLSRIIVTDMPEDENYTAYSNITIAASPDSFYNAIMKFV